MATFEALRLRAAIISAIAYVLFGIACTQIPLVNTLGYEFAFVTALFVAVTMPFTRRSVRRAVEDAPPTESFRDLVAMHLALLALPLSVMMLNASFVKNCALETGVLLFLFIPVPTLLFTSAIIVGLSFFTTRFLTPIYFVFFFLLLLQPFVSAYLHPQLFAFNHLFGMFIGLSWDETQPPFTTLFLFRLVTIAWTLLILFTISALARRGVHPQLSRYIGQKICIALALVAIALSFLQSDELGFTNSRAHARKVLGAEVNTEHFTIVYDPRSFDQKEIQRVADEHEFQLEEVEAELETKFGHRITSFLYPSREIKRKLLGTESSQVARPWAYEIHLSSDGWRDAIRHELVHVVAGEFAPYLVHAPIVGWYGLVEGLAMAVEWDDGNRTLHEYTAAMRRDGLLPSLQSIMTTRGFLSNASHVSYVASGSFCRWLVETIGVKQMKEIYRRDDLDLMKETPLFVLERRWHRFLDTLSGDKPDRITTSFLFGGQPLYRKVCARAITELLREARSSRDRGDHIAATHQFLDADEMAPNLSAAVGIVSSLFAQGKYDSVLAVTTAYLHNSRRHATLLPLYLARGDAARELGDESEARRCYDFLIEKNIGYGWTDAALMRRAALDDSIAGAKVFSMLSKLARGTIGAVDSLHRTVADSLRLILSESPSCGAAQMCFAKLLLQDSSVRQSDIDALLPLNADRAIAHKLRMMRGALFYRIERYNEASQEYLHAATLSATQTERNRSDLGLRRCWWKLRHR